MTKLKETLFERFEDEVFSISNVTTSQLKELKELFKKADIEAFSFFDDYPVKLTKEDDKISFENEYCYSNITSDIMVLAEYVQSQLVQDDIVTLTQRNHKKEVTTTIANGKVISVSIYREGSSVVATPEDISMFIKAMENANGKLDLLNKK